MTYRYKISTWFQFSCVINGVKYNTGDIFEILSTGERKESLEEVKESARIDWGKERYKDKFKRLEIFSSGELIYVFDSKYGEWQPKPEADAV